ncbi:hypothetical protein C8R44DRAFT_747795 [Mycena epipterygia]|nr:hypothetical protein C8R44DRAFT_747795 [Mycena epipterygia]
MRVGSEWVPERPQQIMLCCAEQPELINALAQLEKKTFQKLAKDARGAEASAGSSWPPFRMISAQCMKRTRKEGENNRARKRGWKLRKPAALCLAIMSESGGRRPSAVPESYGSMSGAMFTVCTSLISPEEKSTSSVRGKEIDSRVKIWLLFPRAPPIRSISSTIFSIAPELRDTETELPPLARYKKRREREWGVISSKNETTRVDAARTNGGGGKTGTGMGRWDRRKSAGRCKGWRKRMRAQRRYKWRGIEKEQRGARGEKRTERAWRGGMRREDVCPTSHVRRLACGVPPPVEAKRNRRGWCIDAWKGRPPLKITNTHSKSVSSDDVPEPALVHDLADWEGDARERRELSDLDKKRGREEEVRVRAWVAKGRITGRSVKPTRMRRAAWTVPSASSGNPYIQPMGASIAALTGSISGPLLLGLIT